MKQTAIDDRTQAQMRPGAITRDGMLGTDARPLVDILEDDNAAVRRLGVTHAAIAARMRALRRGATAGLGETVPVAPHFEVTVEGVRGRLPCPFGDGMASKNNTVVRNLRLDRTISFSDLQVHLVGRHGFYLGRGSRFRLDPAVLVAVLEVSADTESESPESEPGA